MCTKEEKVELKLSTNSGLNNNNIITVTEHLKLNVTDATTFRLSGPAKVIIIPMLKGTSIDEREVKDKTINIANKYSTYYNVIKVGIFTFIRINNIWYSVNSTEHTSDHTNGNEELEKVVFNENEIILPNGLIYVKIDNIWYQKIT